MQGVRRAALLHQDRREPRVRRAGVEQGLQDPGPQPRVQVVDVALQHHVTATGRQVGRLPDDEPERAQPGARVPAAGAEADGGHGHRRHGAGSGAQRGQQGGTGRRAELLVDRAAVGDQLAAAEQLQHGRAGDRDHAVGGARRTAARARSARRAARSGRARRTRRRRRRCPRRRRARRPRGSGSPRAPTPCTAASATASRSNVSRASAADGGVQVGALQQPADVAPGPVRRRRSRWSSRARGRPGSRPAARARPRCPPARPPPRPGT